MKILTKMTLIIALMFSTAYAKEKPFLETVDYVDVNKYMGTWYEIGKLPNKFQKKCLASKAVYSLKDNNTVKVTNLCTTHKNGKLKKAKGIAFIADSETNSKLKVGFAPFFKYLGWFSGDYYIMDLASDYSYVLVGEPSRKFLWILSRTPELDETIYEDLLNIASERGFDVSKVKKSPTFTH